MLQEHCGDHTPGAGLAVDDRQLGQWGPSASFPRQGVWAWFTEQPSQNFTFKQGRNCAYRGGILRYKGEVASMRPCDCSRWSWGSHMNTMSPLLQDWGVPPHFLSSLPRIPHISWPQHPCEMGLQVSPFSGCGDSKLQGAQPASGLGRKCTHSVTLLSSQ